MKALLRKDFYVLNKAILLYAAVILIFHSISIRGGELIAVLYAAMLPMSAFAYDDRSHWPELAAMFPYSPLEIVLSRYVLGWLSVIFFITAGTAGRFVLLPLLSPDSVLDIAGEITQFFMEIGFSFCFLALTMPVYFRFDAEKSRLIRWLAILVIAGLAGAAFSLTEIAMIAGPGTDVDFLLNGWIFLPTMAVLTAVSIPLSMWAYRARQG